MGKKKKRIKELEFEVRVLRKIIEKWREKYGRCERVLSK